MAATGAACRRSSAPGSGAWASPPASGLPRIPARIRTARTPEALSAHQSQDDSTAACRFVSSTAGHPEPLFRRPMPGDRHGVEERQRLQHHQPRPPSSATRSARARASAPWRPLCDNDRGASWSARGATPQSGGSLAHRAVTPGSSGPSSRIPTRRTSNPIRRDGAPQRAVDRLRGAQGSDGPGVGLGQSTPR